MAVRTGFKSPSMLAKHTFTSSEIEFKSEREFHFISSFPMETVGHDAGFHQTSLI